MLLEFCTKLPAIVTDFTEAVSYTESSIQGKSCGLKYSSRTLAASVEIFARSRASFIALKKREGVVGAMPSVRTLQIYKSIMSPEPGGDSIKGLAQTMAMIKPERDRLKLGPLTGSNLFDEVDYFFIIISKLCD